MFTCNSTKLTSVPIIAYNSNIYFARNDPFSHLRSHIQPSAGLHAEHQVGQLFDCKYSRHGYVRRRLAFVGLLVLLTLKMLLSASICCITLSIGAVDSALTLWVVPAESAFSTDRE